MSNQGATDCSNTTSPPLQPYGDISGTGVIIGFMGTAFFVLVLLIGDYLISFDPQKCPFKLSKPHDRNEGDGNPGWWKPNPIDVAFLKMIRKTAHLESCAKNNPHWGKIFDDAIINMCDIQLLTGISLLITGFALLDDQLSAYHWRMIALLAWFSSVTHLSGLTILRTYFCNHIWQKAIRLGLMLLLLVMLMIALIPTGYFAWADADYVSETQYQDWMASSALCFYKSQSAVYQAWADIYWESTVDPDLDNGAKRQAVNESPSMQAVVFSCVILAFGFLSRCVRLLRPASERMTTRVRGPVSFFFRDGLRRLSRINESFVFTILVFRPLLGLFLALRIMTDAFNSMLLEIYWLLLCTLWGTLRITQARKELRFWQDDTWKEENQWTFGQILATLLLLGPLLVIIGLFVSHAADANTTDGEDQNNDTANRPQTLVGAATYQTLDGFDAAISESTSYAHYPLEELDKDLLRGQANDPPWLTPCLVAAFIIMTAGIVMFVGDVFTWNVDRNKYSHQGLAIAEFWITKLGALWFIFLGYPIAFGITIAIGLSLDRLLQKPGSLTSVWRHFLFFFFTIGPIHAMYFLGLLIAFPFFDGGWVGGGNIGVSFKVLGVLFLISYGWYVFIAICNGGLKMLRQRYYKKVGC